VMLGDRFGKWLTLKATFHQGDGEPAYLCRCDCGEHGVVRRASLKAGKSRGCGCVRREKLRGVQPRALAAIQRRIAKDYQGGRRG
jgi:hypothetical protein